MTDPATDPATGETMWDRTMIHFAPDFGPDLSASMSYYLIQQLNKIDNVRVRTASGVIRYAVTAVTTYRKAALARDAARVFSQSVPGRLVLVTCEDWDGSAYLSNAVVLAEPTG